MNIAPYRKAFIAVVAAGITVAQAFGVPVADGLSDNATAVFDAVAAILIYAVPNAK
jgi:predicted MFS family arabinose efflux permease